MKPTAHRRIVIEAVHPELDCGRYAVKREVGDSLEVGADIFKDGHDALSAAIRYRAEDESEWRQAPMHFVENDRWTGSFTLERNTRYLYTIVAWTDAFLSWVTEFRKKYDAGQDVMSEMLEGLRIVTAAAKRASPEERARIHALLDEVRSGETLAERVAV
nr:DUF3416 domain-containing protein [Gemmatimonadota bacterium]